MELLSESGRKTKRNLLLFCAASWALALGGIRPASAGDQSIQIGGIGLETNMSFVLWALAILLLYNLLAFALYVVSAWADKRFDKLQTASSMPPPPPSPTHLPAELRPARIMSDRIEKYGMNTWENILPIVAGIAGLVGTRIAYVNLVAQQ